MKTTTLKNKPFSLVAALVVSLLLVGCVTTDDNYDYRTQQQKDDDMAKDAMHDSMKSLSKKDKKAIKNLGK